MCWNRAYMPLLRSFGRLAGGFYKHVAPTALRLGSRTWRVFQQAAKAAARSQPRKGPLHDPAMAVVAPRPAVLGDVLRSPVPALRGEHFQTRFGEGFVQFVTIIGLAADPPPGPDESDCSLVFSSWVS